MKNTLKNNHYHTFKHTGKNTPLCVAPYMGDLLSLDFL